MKKTRPNPGIVWRGHIDQLVWVGKQDRVARENVGLKIILRRPLFSGAEGWPIALFTSTPVFAADEKPVYTGR